MTYFTFRVVLWYLPVSPWSWSYMFACMIGVRLNQGRHKLVSEPTACRNPPSNSLAEVESKLYKTFTNMAVRPIGPRRHWVVVGSFTPRPILWDSYFSSIRVKWFLLKSNIRISLSLSPGEPLINDDRLRHVKTLKILSVVNPRTYVHRICNSPSTVNPYG